MMTKRRIILLALLVVLLLVVGIGGYQYFGGLQGDTAASERRPGIYPDLKLTPGAVDPSETKEKVCTPNHTKTTRHVTPAMKRKVFERYGLSYDEREEDAWEVDHFIPLVLGGANDVLNLWPEPADPRPGFHEKDIVEVYLRRQVCSGAMSLGEAQEAIRKDWYAVYKEWCTKRKNKRKPCVKAEGRAERVQ